MQQGISLHIGVNIVDINHYGDENTLYGCRNDAIAMQTIADKQNFESSILLDDQATTTNVIQKITQAADRLKEGDSFFMTYSGHGGQVLDESGDDKDNDETLCLFDRQYRDDEFNRQLARFVSGVKIIWVSDSCHATNNFRNLDDSENEETLPPSRSLGLNKSVEVLKNNKSVYADWFAHGDFMRASTPTIAASLLQLAACKEEQLSGDAFEDDPHPQGVFTSRLLHVWDQGNFSGTYQALIDQVGNRIPADWNQTPQLVLGGHVEDKFAEEKPFII